MRVAGIVRTFTTERIFPCRSHRIKSRMASLPSAFTEVIGLAGDRDRVGHRILDHDLMSVVKGGVESSEHADSMMSFYTGGESCWQRLEGAWRVIVDTHQQERGGIGVE
jgi:hypothetical protein